MMHERHTPSPRQSVDRDGLNSTVRNRSPLTYFISTFALSIPVWSIGALTDFQLLPGIPVSALGFLSVLGAASLLVYRENDFAGVVELLKRSFDFKRVNAKIWYLLTIWLMPCIMVLSYVVMRFTGVLLPVPQFSLTKTIALFVRLLAEVRE